MNQMNAWLFSHTFHYEQFDDTEKLLVCKQTQNVRVSLAIPTLDEEKTIASVVEMVLPLRDQIPLLDEIAVIDSGSNDQTRSIAARAGADVYLASDILPESGPATGKGENLWKAVYQLKGDILIFLDGDLISMHAGFVTGLLGPLLTNPDIGYVKGCYERPGEGTPEAGCMEYCGGGRLTEILVRPLLSLFAPQLTVVRQPLAGEYAARRSVLEQLSFPVGYGVELAHLLDLAASHGLSVLAQTDLGKRCHRHRDNLSLGRTAYALLKVMGRRLQRQGAWHIPGEVPPLQQFVRCGEQYELEIVPIEEPERPPLVEVASYRSRHAV